MLESSRDRYDIYLTMPACRDNDQQPVLQHLRGLFVSLLLTKVSNSRSSGGCEANVLREGKGNYNSI